MPNRFDGVWESYFQTGTHPDPFPNPPPVPPEGRLTMTQISEFQIQVIHSGDPLGTPPHMATTDNASTRPSISFDRPVGTTHRIEYRGRMEHENKHIGGGTIKSSIRGSRTRIRLGVTPAADVVEEDGTWTANRPPPGPGEEEFLRELPKAGKRAGAKGEKQNKRDSSGKGSHKR